MTLGAQSLTYVTGESGASPTAALSLGQLLRLICLGSTLIAVSGYARGAQNTDWPNVGGGVGEPHYSDQAQINHTNVSRLGLQWSLDLSEELTLEATPIEVDGVLYFSGYYAKVYAVDAVTGKMIWKYDPESWKYRPWHQRLVPKVNRGVAYADGKIYVGCYDGRLQALDAKTGKLVWSVMTLPDKGFYYSTGAPRIVKDKVVIGNGGADAGARGYVTAYDLRTGKQAWRFYTAPGNPTDGFEQPAMKMAAKTWSGEWWKVGTGGTVWNGMVYDPDLNLLYLGVGNAGPWNPRLRNPGNGDNLFLTSIVALNPDTGKYVWHYQINPNEAWDYKATADMILADIKIDGAPHKVIMQAPSNGFFYVLDRADGKLLSADHYVKTSWASRIDLKTGRPVEADNIRYAQGPFELWPSPYGGHNWQPMSYNPETGLVYIPYMEAGTVYTNVPGVDAGSFGRSWKAPYAGGAAIAMAGTPKNSGTGGVVAWDPLTQKMRWRVEYPHMWNGGTLTTAGNLVFAGDGEGLLHAYDAGTGKEVWHFDAKLGIVGAPMTYTLGGRQYISILVGWGGGAIPFAVDYISKGWKYGVQPRRLLTFALDGQATLPATPPRDFSVAAIDDPKLVLDEAAVKRGAMLYPQCGGCHGNATHSVGAPAPDLRESAAAANFDAFRALLHDGGLEPRGMPKFEDYAPAEVRDLFMYIRAKAREALGQRPEAGEDAPASTQ